MSPNPDAAEEELSFREGDLIKVCAPYLRFRSDRNRKTRALFQFMHFGRSFLYGIGYSRNILGSKHAPDDVRLCIFSFSAFCERFSSICSSARQ